MFCQVFMTEWQEIIIYFRALSPVIIIIIIYDKLSFATLVKKKAFLLIFCFDI